MADDVVANAGAGGAIFATDQELGGRHYPWTKPVWGPDDVFNKVDDTDGKRLPVVATLQASATIGLSKYHAVCAASTNAATIKASAGAILAIRAFNAADYPIFFKFHNTAGAPTAGVGVVEAVGVQAGTQIVHQFHAGDLFTIGLGITIVKGIADADATPVALNDGVIDVFYK